MKHIFKFLSFIMTMSFLMNTNEATAQLGDVSQNPIIEVFLARTDNNIFKVGKPVEIVWVSVNSITCDFTSGTNTQQVGVTGVLNITPVSAGQMTVSMKCFHENGNSLTRFASFQVEAVNHPELLTLNVNTGYNVPIGSSVTLSWTSEFTQYCELSGTHSDELTTNGSQIFTVLPGLNVYSVTCFRPNFGTGFVPELESNTIFRAVNGGTPPPIIHNLSISNLAGPFYLVSWSSNSDFCLLDNISVQSNGNEAFYEEPFPVSHFLTCIRDGLSETQVIQFNPF